MKTYYREADGHTYYFKGEDLYGTPTHTDGTWDEDCEIPVEDFDMPLTEAERLEIETALV